MGLIEIRAWLGIIVLRSDPITGLQISHITARISRCDQAVLPEWSVRIVKDLTSEGCSRVMYLDQLNMLYTEGILLLRNWMIPLWSQHTVMNITRGFRVATVWPPVRQTPVTRNNSAVVTESPRLSPDCSPVKCSLEENSGAELVIGSARLTCVLTLCWVLCEGSDIKSDINLTSVFHPVFQPFQCNTM